MKKNNPVNDNPDYIKNPVDRERLRKKYEERKKTAVPPDHTLTSIALASIRVRDSQRNAKLGKSRKLSPIKDLIFRACEKIQNPNTETVIDYILNKDDFDENEFVLEEYGSGSNPCDIKSVDAKDNHKLYYKTRDDKEKDIRIATIGKYILEFKKVQISSMK
jgi:hypothetical protein